MLVCRSWTVRPLWFFSVSFYRALSAVSFLFFVRYVVYRSHGNIDRPAGRANKQVGSPLTHSQCYEYRDAARVTAHVLSAAQWGFGAGRWPARRRPADKTHFCNRAAISICNALPSFFCPSLSLFLCTSPVFSFSPSFPYHRISKHQFSIQSASHSSRPP